MQQNKMIKVWARIGAYITRPLQQIQQYFDGNGELDWEGNYSPKYLYESGDMEFEGDCYIPDESFEELTFADGETAKCSFCTSLLYASPMLGYKWYCQKCDTHFKDFITRKTER